MQGSYKFFCLTTGQLLVRRRWTPMPGIPTTIINAVLKFADKEHRPDGVAFRNRHNESFKFSNDDIDDILLTRQHDVAPFPDIANELPGPMTVTPVTPDPVPPEPIRDEIALQAANNAGLAINVIADPGMPLQHVHPLNDDNLANSHVTDNDDTDNDDNAPDDDSTDTTHTPPSSAHSSSDASSDDDDSDDDAPQPNPPPTTRSGRSRKLPPHLDEYHLYAQSIDESTLHHIDDDMLATVCVHIMVQYANKLSTKSVKQKSIFSLASGLKRFGERGEAAVMKELSQFNVLNAFTPLDASTLTHDQRKNALASLIFLTEK